MGHCLALFPEQSLRTSEDDVRTMQGNIGLRRREVYPLQLTYRDYETLELIGFRVFPEPRDTHAQRFAKVIAAQ